MVSTQFSEMQDKKLSILFCPRCEGDIEITVKNIIRCRSCRSVLGKRIGNILSFAETLSDDLTLSSQKWDDFYEEQKDEKKYKAELSYYKKNYLKDVLGVFPFDLKKQKTNTYLEIGCGNFFLGQEVASSFGLIIGIDLSMSALLVAQQLLLENKIKNFILIQGNILHLPLKDNTIDAIYGGGVIEHFKNTKMAVDEMYRVLKVGGYAINTVPYLNLASLSYRQLWGNIPNMPILRQLAEFIHIKLLRGRHMIFGYEMSFLGTTLTRIHKKSGFKEVGVDRFKISLQFAFLPKPIRPIFNWLAVNSRLFWPMIKVTAIK